MKDLMKKIKDLPLDKRVDVVSKIVARLSIRAHKTTAGIISPQTIMICKEGEDIRGDIFKGMIFKGEISKLIIAFNERPKSTICIEIKSLSMKGGTATTLYTDVRMSNHKLNIETKDGSMIIVTIYPMDDKYKITECWASMLWTPDISKSKVEQHLIDNLIGGIDEGI